MVSTCVAKMKLKSNFMMILNQTCDHEEPYQPVKQSLTLPLISIIQILTAVHKLMYYLGGTQAYTNIF